MRAALLTTPANRGAVRPSVARLVLTASAVVAAGLASIPLVYLLVRVLGAEPDAVLTALMRPRTLELAANTVGLTVAVAAACLVLGTATAWVLSQARLPGRRVWTVVSTLPLAVPSYVAAFGWVALSPVRGFWGAFLVLTVCNVPLVTLPALAALRMANPSHEDVARTLGRSRARAFLETTWPQIRPATLAGVLLVALYVLSDFGAVALMRFEVFTWAVHSAYTSQFDRTLAAALSTVLAAMGIALVWAERRLRGRESEQGSAVTARAARTPVALGRWTWAAPVVLSVAPVAAVVVPMATLLRYFTGRADTATTVGAADLASDALSTVTLSAGGAAVALALALPIGLLAARFRSHLSQVLESASYIGLALPGIVVGLSLVFFSLAVVPALYQSVWMLAFAYGVLFLPKAVGAVRASVGQVEPGLEDVARTLGSTRAGVWTRVTARIAWPGIGAAVLLVALTAMKELPATLLLRPTGTDTLATSLWRLTESAAYGAAAPYALVLVAVAAGPALLLTREAVATVRERRESA
ncbi:ABC transporter permease [Demequina zhanjiangensis]|uniref:Iron ABC transporter permease n=1 Tax=Demequina zhanjiangensis TaxID=3051659 RepID=A0ABT8FZG0_9MICO|nr:iron ABC transporter permease [Demequina sp. SYSU T00b26]MDN4472104.1 iron ABC transporter permease [Demequina sp. SYSU T00b26]